MPSLEMTHITAIAYNPITWHHLQRWENVSTIVSCNLVIIYIPLTFHLPLLIPTHIYTGIPGENTSAAPKNLKFDVTQTHV